MGEVHTASVGEVSRHPVWRVRSVLAYLAAWSPMVLVYTLLIGTGERMPVSMAIMVALQSVGGAAIAGIGVLWYLRRDPWTGTLSTGFVVRHTAVALLYSFTWLASVLVNMRLGTSSWSNVFAEATPWIGWQLFFGVVLYVVMGSTQWIGASMSLARETEARRMQADALRARAELEALRGRLDPHFLFNTLHSLSVLARHDPAQTQVALGQLADLLRYVLDSKRGAREQVPFADELAFVQAYLALESLRFGERLRIHTSIDDDALDVVVPSLSLQPLVENAIRHAVTPRASGGAVNVSAHLEHDALVLAVKDDGAGSTPDSDATTQGAAPSTAGTGVGLDALRRRLALVYGDSARLDTVASPEGFTVTMRIPA